MRSLAVFNGVMNINRVTLEYNQEFIMFIFYSVVLYVL